MGIDLDFSGIDSIKRVDGDSSQYVQDDERKVVLDLEREKELVEEARKIYKEYQANIKATEELRVDILKTTNQDQRITKDLFMKAIKIVSLLCHEPTFYDQIEKRVTE